MVQFLGARYLHPSGPGQQMPPGDDHLQPPWNTARTYVAADCEQPRGRQARARGGPRENARMQPVARVAQITPLTLQPVAPTPTLHGQQATKLAVGETIKTLIVGEVEHTGADHNTAQATSATQLLDPGSSTATTNVAAILRVRNHASGRGQPCLRWPLSAAHRRGSWLIARPRRPPELVCRPTTRRRR